MQIYKEQDSFRTYCNDRFQKQNPPTIKQLVIFDQTITSWEIFSNTFMAIVWHFIAAVTAHKNFLTFTNVKEIFTW